MTRQSFGTAILAALWSTIVLPNFAAGQSAIGAVDDVQATTDADVALDGSGEAEDTTQTDAGDDSPALDDSKVDSTAGVSTEDDASGTDSSNTIEATPSGEPSERGLATPSSGAGANAPPNPAAQLEANINVQANVNRSGTPGNPDIAAQQRATTGLQFDQATDRGLAINSVDRQSFFYESGLRRGDVIVSYGGRNVRTPMELGRWVVYQPGQRVPVIVLRDGRQETIYVTYRAPREGADDATYPRAAAQAYLGISLDQDSRGAVVQAVNPGSPAEQAGLQSGDMILSLNGRGVTGWREVPLIVSSMQAGDQLEIVYSRPVQNRVVTTLGIRNVDAPLAVRVAPAVSVPAAYEAPAGAVPTPAVGVPATNVPPAPVQPLPARRLDEDRDGRILDRDRGPLRD